MLLRFSPLFWGVIAAMNSTWMLSFSPDAHATPGNTSPSMLLAQTATATPGAPLTAPAAQAPQPTQKTQAQQIQPLKSLKPTRQPVQPNPNTQPAKNAAAPLSSELSTQPAPSIIYSTFEDTMPLPAAPAVAGLPAGMTQTAQMAGMTEYQLANGLKIVLVPDPGKPTITVNVTYHVGSRHENYGETGMAHLLEHLLFKGTPSIPNLTQELSSRGMRPNGTTWYDRTNYFETFASSDANLEWALKMEADRMVNAFIARKDLDSEMTVVRNEMESGENDPQRILIQKMTAIAYQWHNYGKDTIGARSDVENVSIQHLREFYTRYYQPDNAVLVVAGDFDTPRVLRWIHQYFGVIPRPERTLPKSYTEEPAQDGERSVQLRRVGSQQSLAALYRIPSATHADFPALQVLLEVLAHTPSGRLHKVLVDSQQAAEVSGYAYPLREPGHLILNAELREEAAIEQVKKRFLQTVESTGESPITEEEIARGKQVLMNRWNQVLRDPQRLGVALSQAIAVGDWRVFLLNQERIAQVTVHDVQRVAQYYLRAHNRTLGEFIPTQTPERVTIPAAEPLAAQLAQFKPVTTITQGEAFNPTYENIEQRVNRFRLKNGARIAVLSKKNRGEAVSLYAQLHWGDETSLKASRWKGELLAAMLMRGTQRLSHKQLIDQLEKLNAQLSMDSSADGLTLRLETTRPNLAAVVGLIGEILKTPRFDTQEWAVLKQQTLAGLEAARTEPASWASRQLERYQQPYSPDDPRYTTTLEEDIDYVEGLDVKEVQAFYKDMLSTQNSEWAIVGHTDAADPLKDLLETTVGDLRKPLPYQRLTQAVFPVASDILVKHLSDRANAMLDGRLLIAMQDTDPDYPALIAANTLLGGGFLNSRLAMRIRQKEGISYGVGSYLKASADDPYAEWRIYALFAPQNRERLLKVIHEELTTMQKEPVDANALKQAIEGWLESRRLVRSQDDRLAVSLAEWMRLGRTGHDMHELEQKVKTLTPEAVQAAIRKYLQPSQWVFSVAGTFPLNADNVDALEEGVSRPLPSAPSSTNVPAPKP